MLNPTSKNSKLSESIWTTYFGATTIKNVSHCWKFSVPTDLTDGDIGTSLLLPHIRDLDSMPSGKTNILPVAERD